MNTCPFTLKGKRSFRHFLTFSLFLTAGPAHTGRPFVTDDAGTVSTGTFEAESGIKYRKNASSVSFTLNHGVTDLMEIGFGGCYIPLPEERKGFGNAELGLKFSLVQELFSISAGGSLGDRAYWTSLVFSKAVSFISLDANIGIEAGGGTDVAAMSFGVCCRYEGKRFGAGVELNGTHKGGSVWQTGGRFAVADWLNIDAGIIGSIENPVEITALAGVTFALPVIKG